MRRILDALVALVVAVSLVLIPAVVSADLGKCTGWDKVKWEDNQNSWKIYLQHWGRTPTSAMSRLAGLCGPDKLCSGVCNISKCPQPTGCDISQCLGGCSNANTQTGTLGSACTTAQNALNPSTAPTSLPLDDCTLNCPTATTTAGLGLSKCSGCWGKSLSFAGKSWATADLGTNSLITNTQLNHGASGSGGLGGDWGITGCMHPECVSQTWCLQNNLLSKCSICK
ncbi:MAG: hypothetical protein ACYDHZ_01185 [Dehalococcoidia bacterium]